MKNSQKGEVIGETLLLISVLAIVGFAGYGAYIFFSHPKNAPVTNGSLANQQICSNAASSYFNGPFMQDYAQSPSNGYTYSYSYTDHYNTKLNKCFILAVVDSQYPSTYVDVLGKTQNVDVLGESHYLIDALEGTEYAQFHDQNWNEPTQETLGGVIDEQLPPSKVPINSNEINSTDEFNNYIKPYMSN